MGICAENVSLVILLTLLQKGVRNNYRRVTIVFDMAVIITERYRIELNHPELENELGVHPFVGISNSSTPKSIASTISSIFYFLEMSCIIQNKIETTCALQSAAMRTVIQGHQG